MVRHPSNQRARANQTTNAPVPTARRRSGRWVAVGAVAVLAILSVTGYLLLQGGGPGIEAVTPRNEADLNPQLKAYLPRFIAAVNANPRDYLRHSELGLVYEANEFWHEARDCFENALKLAPNEPLPWHHLAIVQNQLGDADAALATLRDLTRRVPDFAPAQHRLGVTMLNNGELAEAESAFRQVISLQPGRPEGYIGLADVKVRSKDFTGAKDLLDQALAINPRDGIARHLMGLVYLGLGREEEAQREMALGKQAGALVMVDAWAQKLPEHATSLARQNTRAVALMNAGKLQEAARVFEECLRYHPDNPDILNNLSTIRAHQGRPREELMLLQRAVAANPRHHPTYSNLASHYLQANNTEKAIEEMTKAIALAPTDASYHRKMAAMLTSLSRYAEARDHWAEAARHEPGNARNFAKLAEACMQLGLHAEAVEAVEHAKRLAPHDPNVIAIANQVSGLSAGR